MATVKLTTDNHGNNQTVTWTGMTTGDYGQPWPRSDYSDKCWQVGGSFGSGGTMTLWGSNLANPGLTDDTDWFQLNDVVDLAVISESAAAGGQILENPRWIRPKVASGTTPSITVTIEATKVG